MFYKSGNNTVNADLNKLLDKKNTKHHKLKSY